MPILDPFLQMTFLLERDDSKKEDSDKNFFILYLEHASRFTTNNLYSIKSSIQFKRDLQNNLPFINSVFKCSLSIEKDFNNPLITNYYQYFLNKIDPNNESKRDDFVYYGYCYIENETGLRFYQQKVLFFTHHRLYLTETPLAILCLYLTGQKDFSNILDYINLEIDILETCGYFICLCVYYEVSNVKIDLKNLVNMIIDHQFIEIHFNIINSYSKSNDLELFLNEFYQKIDCLKAFCYIYFEYIQESFQKVDSILKKFKQNPLFQIISLSENPSESIRISKSFNRTPVFYHFQAHYMSDIIFVRLSNVPLYQTDDEETDFVPIEISGVSTAYMSIKDFIYWNGERVKILFDNEEKTNNFYYRYVNREDIHLIRPELYVKENLFLTKITKEALSNVFNIHENISYKLDNNKEVSLSFFNKKKSEKVLKYVIYAYSKYYRNIQHVIDFNMHKNQIFTAIEACKMVFEKNKKHLGVVYQVETGEGKSSIVCIIAALLALMKKSVHIASSNIVLSNRDYYDSFEFFKQLGLKTALLCHYNELPIFSENSNDGGFDINYYPREFFKKSLFKNSSNMNFSVCGINDNNEITQNKADIIFSTFINLECFYLRMMEMCPGYIDTYFRNCSLIIDEADSILIDELTNGTILSRSLKTNGKEVLTFVFQQFKQGENEERVLNEIKNKWPQCKDLRIDDIQDMFNEIRLVTTDEFVDGKKYSIESKIVKEKHDQNSLIQVKNENNTRIKKKSSIKRLFSKKERKSLGQNENIYKKSSNRKTKTYKQIIPFDYEHKGILEPNKEFSGFVQQFIAIKEMFNNKENENMIIKDVSMNYLYVSHPIFVSLYGNVCGLTGTVGNKYDKQLLENQYNLITKKIPRENPNLRVEFPIILCEDIKERNNKIVNEIVHINKEERPILVIFQDFNEIFDVYVGIVSSGIKNIYIFDGKDEKVKPDRIAGVKNVVSLGTNFCGRGTDIKKPEKPLHVILAYYSSNSRVIGQAFGRTARQGQEGTTRIICLKNQYFSPISIFNENIMEGILDDFQFKNKFQRDFIDKFRMKRKWIFSSDIQSQVLSDDNIKKLRDTKINVNRIKAYNFSFPICMSIPTFLLIQAQKIFSLYNCPNCKYTWMLFQKYVREMILESWSLFIEKVEKKYYKNNIKKSFKEYLTIECESLYAWLSIYLPDSKNIGIVETFMHIFNLVRNKFEQKILGSFPTELSKCLLETDKKRYVSFTFGFKPFSLVDESGSKINIINGEEQKQTYISDPELKYIRKQPKHCFSIISITERIDDIFNMICQKINSIVGCYIGLKFFLRRTLGGCEFGVCYDFEINNNNKSILIDQNCLVDKDPLLVFTISVKSMIPILAGILIIGLVYIASVAESILSWIFNFFGKGAKEVIKFTVKIVASKIINGKIGEFCNAICSFLSKKIDKQINQLKDINPDLAGFLNTLLSIATVKNFKQSGNLLHKLIFGDNESMSIDCSFADSLADGIPIKHFLKIGLLLLMCFATFMLNFHYSKHKLTYDVQNVSEEYDTNQNVEQVFEENKNLIEVDKIENTEEFEFKNDETQ